MEGLPPEVWVRILSSLSFRDRLRIRALSRDFRSFLPPPVTKWRDLLNQQVIRVEWQTNGVSQRRVLSRLRKKTRARNYLGPSLKFYFVLQDSEDDPLPIGQV